MGYNNINNIIIIITYAHITPYFVHCYWCIFLYILAALQPVAQKYGVDEWQSDCIIFLVDNRELCSCFLVLFGLLIFKIIALRKYHFMSFHVDFPFLRSDRRCAKLSDLFLNCLLWQRKRDWNRYRHNVVIDILKQKRKKFWIEWWV